jgi:2-amino-4-hydroxy-6-hydroxymethyldihydropteridine diphosphokinase
LNENGPHNHEILLSIGSNIRPQENLPKAFELLREEVHIEEVSKVWKCPAVGGDGPDFLNAALRIRTHLAPEILKRQVLRPIEARLGRVRTENKYAPRPIDLDILIVDGSVHDPQIWKQVFLAVPLADLLPTLENSENGETLSEAAARLAENHPIETCPEPRLDCFDTLDME